MRAWKFLACLLFCMTLSCAIAQDKVLYHIDTDPGAQISGVVRIAELQGQGAAYIKP